jgi:hypothetical protein
MNPYFGVNTKTPCAPDVHENALTAWTVRAFHTKILLLGSSRYTFPLLGCNAGLQIQREQAKRARAVGKLYFANP